MDNKTLQEIIKYLRGHDELVPIHGETMWVVPIYALEDFLRTLVTK